MMVIGGDPNGRGLARNSQNIVTIQYLRAFAAIMVAVFHIGEIYGFNPRFGAAGVDLFFVISGFIMWLVTRKREARLTYFLTKRFLRLVPLYWLVTIFLATCSTLWPGLLPLTDLTPTHVILSMLFIPHLSPDGVWTPLVMQGWTMNYEMFFYLVFAFSLMFRAEGQFKFLNISLLSLTIIGCILNRSPHGWMSVYRPTLLLEFLAGIYIARAWLSNNVLGANVALIAIAAGIAWIFLVYIENPLWFRAFKYGIPAASIVFGAISYEKRKSVPYIGWLKLLGDASYAIYLVNFLAWLSISLLFSEIANYEGPWIYPFALIGTIFFGTSTHLFIEKPIRKFLSGDFHNR